MELRFVRLLIVWVLALLFSLQLTAQIVVNFQPALNGLTLGGLERVKVVNSTAEQMTGTLKISVQDENGSMVVNILTTTFVIHPGVNVLNTGIFTNGKISFGNSPAVKILSQTGRFPEGSFQYCFEFDAAPPKLNGPVIPYENCYNYDVQPYTPLLLMSPANQASICNPRPDFSWQPPFPSGPQMRYRLIVVDVLAGQQPADALDRNLPVINKANLNSNLLLYPSELAPLVMGHHYGWQLTAYVGTTIVQRSEIWTFTYQCDQRAPDSTFNSYTEVKPDKDENFYIADKVLKFAVFNPYKGGVLEYSIIDLADPATDIKKLPRINLQNGLNKVDLRLSGNRAFISGHMYLMKMNNISNHPVMVRFTYAQ